MKILSHLTIYTAVLGLLLTSYSMSAQAKKGAEVLRGFYALKTIGDIESLKSGDVFAMACSKCKTIWTSQVKKGVKGAQVLKEGGVPKALVGLHLCEGCGSKVEIKGHGKGRKAVIQHVCEACGEDSPFCCATRGTAGAKEAEAVKD